MVLNTGWIVNMDLYVSGTPGSSVYAYVYICTVNNGHIERDRIQLRNKNSMFNLHVPIKLLRIANDGSYVLLLSHVFSINF